jgi:hypothetical protein
MYGYSLPLCVYYHLVSCITRHLGLQLNRSGVAKTYDRMATFSLTDSKTILKRQIISGPRQLGFDRFQGLSASLDMPPYLHVENDKFLEADALEWVEKAPSTRQGPAGQSFTRINVSNTILHNARDFLRSNINSSSRVDLDLAPVFLFLSLTSPHTPILPSSDFQKKSSLGPYGDYVMQTDDAVGQIITELKNLNAYENSLVIFTSDNGFSRDVFTSKKNKFLFPHKPSGIYRGEKADIYEGGHRVPLVVQWPAVIAPQTTNADPVSLTDLFATFADIVNVVRGQQGQRQGGKGGGGGHIAVRRPLHGEDSFSLLPLFLQGGGHGRLPLPPR